MTVSYRDQRAGERLRQLRRARELSQDEISKRTGILQSDVSRMERGVYRISLESLYLICAALDVSVTEVLEDAFNEDREAHLRPVRVFRPGDLLEVRDDGIYRRAAEECD